MSLSSEKVKAQQEVFECPPWAAQPRPGLRFDVLKGDRVVEAYLLDGQPYYLFGRSKTQCDYVLSNPSVSRVHFAVVHHHSGSVFVIDLGSNQGTTVDGVAIDRKTTKVLLGQCVQAGNSTRVYRLQDPKLAPLNPTLPTLTGKWDKDGREPGAKKGKWDGSHGSEGPQRGSSPAGSAKSSDSSSASSRGRPTKKARARKGQWEGGPRFTPKAHTHKRRKRSPSPQSADDSLYDVSPPKKQKRPKAAKAKRRGPSPAAPSTSESPPQASGREKEAAEVRTKKKSGDQLAQSPATEGTPAPPPGGVDVAAPSGEPPQPGPPPADGHPPVLKVTAEVKAQLEADREAQKKVLQDMFKAEKDLAQMMVNYLRNFTQPEAGPSAPPPAPAFWQCLPCGTAKFHHRKPLYEHLTSEAHSQWMTAQSRQREAAGQAGGTLSECAICDAKVPNPLRELHLKLVHRLDLRESGDPALCFLPTDQTDLEEAIASAARMQPVRLSAAAMTEEERKADIVETVRRRHAERVKQRLSKEEEARKAECWRAMKWLTFAKGYLHPMYKAGRLTKEQFKEILGQAMRTPFDTQPAPMLNAVSLKDILDKLCAPFNPTETERLQQMEVFKAELASMAS